MSPFWNCKYPKYFALQLLCFFEVWTQRQNCRQTEAQTGGQKRLECSSWWWEAKGQSHQKFKYPKYLALLLLLFWVGPKCRGRGPSWRNKAKGLVQQQQLQRGKTNKRPATDEASAAEVTNFFSYPSLGIPSGIFGGHQNERLDRWMLLSTKCSFRAHFVNKKNKMRLSEASDRRFSLRCWDH